MLSFLNFKKFVFSFFFTCLQVVEIVIVHFGWCAYLFLASWVFHWGIIVDFQFGTILLEFFFTKLQPHWSKWEMCNGVENIFNLAVLMVSLIMYYVLQNHHLFLNYLFKSAWIPSYNRKDIHWCFTIMKMRHRYIKWLHFLHLEMETWTLWSNLQCHIRYMVLSKIRVKTENILIVILVHRIFFPIFNVLHLVLKSVGRSNLGGSVSWSIVL